MPFCSASFRPVVFRELLICRLLGPPPKGVRVKGLEICILRSNNDSDADEQVTTLGKNPGLDFLLYLNPRLWIR